MKLKVFRPIPVWIAFGVILSVCVIRCLKLDTFERLENMTFDIRSRTALHSHTSLATNIGFVFINEESVRRVWDGSLGYHFGLFWPRQVYGRLVQELATQGAKAVAFDVLFGELRPDHALVNMGDGTFLGSDEFFALQMHQSRNVILATTAEIVPPPLFRTNAVLGDIETEKDSDGILRRAKAFQVIRQWHPAFQKLGEDPDYAVDLRLARIEPGKIVLPRPTLGDIQIPLDANGNFDLADFGGEKLPAGRARKAKPFLEERVWHMGLVLAACELDLDLANAKVDLAHGTIVLQSRDGLERRIPVDHEGYFYIDWSMPENQPVLSEEAIHDLLAQSRYRLEGSTNALSSRWAGKLVVVGSSGVVGNNLTDRGATPLSADTVLVSKHWNIANSLITGRFVRRSPLGLDLALIAFLGLIAAALSWKLRVIVASASVGLASVLYIIVSVLLYVQTRYWIPIVFPVAGALVITYISLITWRVVFEQAERRRLKSIFSTIVSPKIVQELLNSEKLALGGARREVSVFFADVRGFTELTDASQEKMAEFVRQKNLKGSAAAACFDEQARQTLETINLYLGCVAETILEQDGTLDKFIGDCVMAFWGAPTPNPKHALACVNAAIGAQRAIHELNRRREAENERRRSENIVRASNGVAPRPLLPILLLGTGINTGMVTVGLMGSEAKAGVVQGSYTVFGREVNLASRLEAASGHAHIFISQATFQQLQLDDPSLAASCVALGPIVVKGIRGPVQIYEVPWRLPETLLPPSTVPAGSNAAGATFSAA